MKLAQLCQLCRKQQTVIDAALLNQCSAPHDTVYIIRCPEWMTLFGSFDAPLKWRFSIIGDPGEWRFFQSGKREGKVRKSGKRWGKCEKRGKRGPPQQRDVFGSWLTKTQLRIAKHHQNRAERRRHEASEVYPCNWGVCVPTTHLGPAGRRPD